jgi:type VI secretion system protein ImpL
MLSFVKNRRFLTVLGLVLLAVFIWYAGPYFAFADYRPFESATARVVAIALVIAAWGASVLLKRYRANRASDELAAAVVKQPTTDRGRPNADAAQLRERFEEAIAVLKQKRRRSGHNLYDVPWYVIIGAPGSGKTTALVNSGLHFPLEQRTGKGALRGVGGTRNCDWWFTDEAVFLDTAGRYLTQDSDAAADSEDWAEFLALLRKYRGRRPINGVILTLSTSDLLTASPADYERHVAAARRRLNELNRDLRIQLPVYVMVTKCDLVAGFTEYFDDLDRDGRAQVWGVTFPYEQTTRGEAARTFPAEFDLLIARLNGQLFGRLEEERDVRRRARSFGFPQQMAAVRDGLSQFVNDVFGSTRFDQQVLLRGVYFTSGTQEGMPIDRLLAALGRRFAVAPEAVAPPSGRGKAYFVERLLKDVLLAESGLAGVNRRFEVQLAAAQLGLYIAMASVAVLGIVLWTVSYSRNRTYIDAVAADVARLRGVPPIAADAPLESALPRLDALRAVVDSAGRFGNAAPWAMRWGLYQGTSLRDAARDAYARELDGMMLPHVAQTIRRRLSDYAAEPERLYEYLRAYLMLGHPEHLNKPQLAAVADLEWQSAYGDDPDRVTALTKHFRSLLEFEESLRPMPLDDTIVAQARSTLRQASPAGLVYRAVRSFYASDTERALRLDREAGLGAERVLRLKNRISLAEPMPSIYTKRVFEEITNKGTDAIVKELTEEFWVWGDARPSILGSAKLTADFIDIYEKDYIAAWDRIVNAIETTPLSSLDETKRILMSLSGPTSPLRGLLEVVDKNTYFAKPTEAPKPGLLGGIGSRIGGAIGRGRAAAGVPAVMPGAQITAHFEPIHLLLAGDKGNAPIDQILKKVGELQKKIENMGNGVGQTAPGDSQSIASVGVTVNELKRDVTQLPPSISTVLTQVANGTSLVVRVGAGNILQNLYEQEVVSECNAIIANRYPFSSDSANDVPLADFGRLFGYNGVYDNFFKTQLSQLVDASRVPWTWKVDSAGERVGGSVAMLRQFEAVGRIREMFFRAGAQEPEARFSVAAVDLDAAAIRFTLDVDGQPFEYRHGPVIATRMVWPGPNPGKAVATFEERSGNRPNIPAEGPWAWFRLIDQAGPQRETDAAYVLTFERGGHQSRIRVESVSIRNPYGNHALQQFRCG